MRIQSRYFESCGHTQQACTQCAGTTIRSVFPFVDTTGDSSQTNPGLNTRSQAVKPGEAIETVNEPCPDLKSGSNQIPLVKEKRQREG